MFSFRKPSPEQIRAFLDRQATLEFSYAEVGASRQAPPRGYGLNQGRCRLGQGRATFDAARAAISEWAMFRVGWVEICRPTTPVEGAVVGVLVRVLPGLWSLNACRVVHLVDEDAGDVARYGFAYGTLPDHIERGEERFGVEWRREDDSVWYDLLAFSRPNHWTTRVFRPVARQFQRRFARDSAAAMRRAVEAGRTQGRTASEGALRSPARGRMAR